MTLITADKAVQDLLYITPHLSRGGQNFLYVFAGWPVYIVPITLLALFFRNTKDRANSVRLFIGSVFTWQILNRLIGTYLYNNYGFRDRPFAATGAKEFFLERPEKAFPSDHAAFLASFVILLYAMGYKKLGNALLIVTIITGFARVMMGFHWPLDILAGWLVGGIGACIYLLVDPYIKTLLYKILKVKND